MCAHKSIKIFFCLPGKRSDIYTGAKHIQYVCVCHLRTAQCRYECVRVLFKRVDKRTVYVAVSGCVCVLKRI